MNNFRVETDSLGEVQVPINKLWGAQTQRSLEYFSIGDDLIPREMISSYAVLKKAVALVSQRGGRLPDRQANLIVQVCDAAQLLVRASTQWLNLTKKLLRRSLI